VGGLLTPVSYLWIVFALYPTLSAASACACAASVCGGAAENGNRPSECLAQPVSRFAPPKASASRTTRLGLHSIWVTFQYVPLAAARKASTTAPPSSWNRVVSFVVSFMLLLVVSALPRYNTDAQNIA